ncbi:MAG: hypothetical protein Q8910_00590 [Bacteroidota bacterium]|nr:hypothetical protein [Bacteroidota bacterium]
MGTSEVEEMIQRYEFYVLDGLPDPQKEANGEWVKWEDVLNVFDELIFPYGLSNDYWNGYVSAVANLESMIFCTHKSN